MVFPDLREPVLLMAEDQVPSLCLPPGYTAEEMDRAFGWAISEAYRRRYGWLGLLRHTRRMADEAA